MKNKTLTIINAVREFGETSDNINIRFGELKAVVFIDDTYFGIYDFERMTFID